jgi:hypothetical protein
MGSMFARRVFVGFILQVVGQHDGGHAPLAKGNADSATLYAIVAMAKVLGAFVTLHGKKPTSTSAQ